MRTQLRSRLAIAVAVLHMSVFVVVIFSRTPLPRLNANPCTDVQPGEVCLDPWSFWGVYVAGRYFHTDIDFKLLSLADLPTLLLVDPLTNVVSSHTNVSRVMQTYIAASIWLTIGTIQWLLIGALLSRARPTRRPNMPAGADR